MPSPIPQRGKSKRYIKYKLLLDEGLSLPKFYPRLNSFHNLKHITHDLRKSGIKDKPLYDLATKQNILLIVFNTKDFKPLIRKATPSVIALSTNLSNKEADLKISKMLRELRLNQTKGYLISITKSETIFKLRSSTAT